MKTRISFVSNSSSSSFVVVETEEKGNPFSGLTAQDWRDAIKALYVPYDENDPSAEECTEVRDLSDDEERRKAICDFGKIMECWFANWSMKDKDGKVIRNPRATAKAINAWEDYIDCISYGRHSWRNGSRTVNNDLGDLWNRHIGKHGYQDEDGYRFTLVGSLPVLSSSLEDALCKYDENLNRSVYKRLPEELEHDLVEKWNSLGICTQRDMLEWKGSKTFVHFDENDIWRLKGVIDKYSAFDEKSGKYHLVEPPNDGVKWQSEEWTFDRVLEVFAKWFRENGCARKNANWKQLKKLIGGISIHEG